jgi:hypothetical protein
MKKNDKDQWVSTQRAKFNLVSRPYQGGAGLG